MTDEIDHRKLNVMPLPQPRHLPQPEHLEPVAAMSLELGETDPLWRLGEARARFSVDGEGLAAAVLDTGLHVSHDDFNGSVVARRNFTGGDQDDVTDRHGHGTHVSGIIAAHGINSGVAPRAGIAPLKVLRGNEPANQEGVFSTVKEALDWVLLNHDSFGISVASISLQDGMNHQTDAGAEADALRQTISRLRAARIPVVVAAGNNYARFSSSLHVDLAQQGMSFPAICREAISVGAIFDADIGEIEFPHYFGARANFTGPGRITPFSQRLHESFNSLCFTTIFAPGVQIRSSGIESDSSSAEISGTSQATPVVTGIIMLMQQFFKRHTGQLPLVDDLVRWLRAVGDSNSIRDGDDELDNVHHTNLNFIRVDAVLALEAVKRQLEALA